MSCDQYEEDLIAAAAGGPSPGPLEAHVARCMSCRDRLENHRRLLAEFDHAVRAGLLIDPSPGFAGRVASRVRQSAAAHRLWRRWTPALAAGVGIVVVAVELVRWPPAPPPASAPKVTADVHATAPQADPRPTGKEPAPASRPRRAPRSHLAISGPLASTTPEVLVPPGQDEALRRLVLALQAGVEPPLLLASAATSEKAVTAPAPLEIAPLAVAPLSDSIDSPSRSDS